MALLLPPINAQNIIMKIKTRHLALIILAITLFSCNRNSEGLIDADTLIIDNLTGMKLSGTVDDNFLYVDNMLQNGDTIKGEYVLQRKSVLVEKKPFSLFLHENGVADLVSADFEGQFAFDSGMINGGIHVIIEKQRKILWVIPWGKTTIDVNLSPYKIKRKKFLAGRYEKDVFKEMEMVKDVKYGEARGYWTSFESDNLSYWEILGKGVLDVLDMDDQDLLLDVYMPADDGVEKRPLLMLIHGGGFYIGDKAEPTYLALAHYYVRKGYVVASINYRMGFIPSAKAVERAGYRGVQDARAALRFLAANHEEYGFDPENIFLAGSSAGAITSLNVAFMDDDERPESANGGLFSKDLGLLDESGNEIQANYKVRAVVNMWGAVDKTSMIDDDEQIALMHFHGDSDQVVPYQCGFPFEDVGGINEWFMPEMCGSRAIQDVADDKDWNSELVTFSGMGHMPHVNDDKSFNENFDTILSKSQDFFLEQLMDGEITIQGDRRISDRQKSCEYSVSGLKPMPIVNWYIVGGVIKEIHDGRADVLWFADEKTHSISCDVVNDIGAHSKLSMSIKLPE